MESLLETLQKLGLALLSKETLIACGIAIALVLIWKTVSVIVRSGMFLSRKVSFICLGSTVMWIGGLTSIGFGIGELNTKSSPAVVSSLSEMNSRQEPLPISFCTGLIGFGASILVGSLVLWCYDKNPYWVPKKN